MEPDDEVWLDLEDVLGLYRQLMRLDTLQQAADQLRDAGGLEGALARPHWHAHYKGADEADQAAVLAHGIAEGQYFVDGNKRLAVVAMTTFLVLRGYFANAPDEELASWILSLSSGLTAGALADLLRGVMVSIA